ncbi:hypothetical protein [Quisquiliibacterium transsilvanicum]|uniref:Uncharacterized protein n=1 Tax=Quisquiliibacterium transsilvanicum TaxID=1549638 RepID=A0A7W8HI91_9BURK|nr:hypothetical protein [Quisquiliibacterium transsilvanicum]MBB5272537.1 hypothetical protein [Quisquiliibacterium transsilvanicum]
MTCKRGHAVRRAGSSGRAQPSNCPDHALAQHFPPVGVEVSGSCAESPFDGHQQAVQVLLRIPLRISAHRRRPFQAIADGVSD